jgi:S1-C subfamily serine protease
MGHPPLGHYQEARPAAADKPRLGVAITEIAFADLDAMGLEYGVRVAQVMADSVADRAGIRSGDVITAFADRPIYSPERLRHLVQDSKGEQTIALQRGDNALTLPVEFAGPKVVGNGILGVRVQAMTRELQEAFGVDAGQGVLVSQVTPASGADQAGVTAGDILISVDGASVSGVSDIRAALADQAAGNSVEIKLVRERQAQTLEVVLSESASKTSSSFVHPRIGYGQGYGYHPHRGMMKKHGCNVRSSTFKS